MEARQLNDDWLGYECKSALMLFYFNKRTGEHKWPCCSKCPEKGLHSNETSSNNGLLHQDRVTSVSIGTQTEEGGCENGCTSSYINKNTNITECIEVGQSCAENSSNSLDKNVNDSSCLHEEAQQEMDEVRVDKNCDHCIYSEQSIATNKEVEHKRKKEEETQKNEEFVDAEKSNETILPDESDNNFHNSVKHTKIIMKKSVKKSMRNVDQIYTMKSSQPFMNLQNVSRIIIENPPLETDQESSSPRRQILEIKVPDGSSSLANSCTTTTGSPSREDGAVVSTGIPRDCSQNKRATLNRKQVSIGTPRNTSPVEISLDATHINTGIPSDHSPAESSTAENGVTTGIPKEQAFNNITTGSPQNSSQELTYTHVIHVDTAITSSNTNSPLSSEYRVIAYPEMEEVSLPEGSTGSKERAATSHQFTTIPIAKLFRGNQKARTQPRFLASPDRLCVCPLCDTVFPNTKTYFEHLFNHCDWKAKKCAICKKIFANRYGLQRHLQSHASYRPYKCNRCGKLFLRSHHLKAHMLTHNTS